MSEAVSAPSLEHRHDTPHPVLGFHVHHLDPLTLQRTRTALPCMSQKNAWSSSWEDTRIPGVKQHSPDKSSTTQANLARDSEGSRRLWKGLTGTPFRAHLGTNATPEDRRLEANTSWKRHLRSLPSTSHMGTHAL